MKITNSYAVSDFKESLAIVGIDKGAIKKAVRAWGSSEGDGWTGGFVVKLKKGGYCKIEGWCDYTGWGCQDGAKVTYADKITKLRPADEKFTPDVNPIDLTRWLNGEKDVL